MFDILHEVDRESTDSVKGEDMCQRIAIGFITYCGDIWIGRPAK